ncbi:hypothetical protein [Desulfobulbus oligotrophicus]|uniref:hypothetical protein n=1 Tax=Desulfobulbus oligotrophicus TaxID=1909699 RepID=UPI001E530BE7|nr:hypothetical protein [Desulfobulbus oligotrophicus]
MIFPSSENEKPGTWPGSDLQTKDFGQLAAAGHWQQEPPAPAGQDGADPVSAQEPLSAELYPSAYQPPPLS